MPRVDQSSERRNQLIPTIAQTFAELGYRRTTTADLARRCRVQEMTLYRIWPDKRAMFVASIEHVFDFSARRWVRLNGKKTDGSTAERLLEFEARHHGEFGLYRILFAGLSESDDPEIARALRTTYAGFARFIAEEIAAHRGSDGATRSPPPDLAAWAFIGLATSLNLSRELGLLGAKERELLLVQAGRLLLRGDKA